jgi:4-alpha-glucanotransferase
VYTGTHDNDTTRGWLEDLDEAGLEHVTAYLACAPEDVPEFLARAALASVARFAIVPMQDVLGLDGRHRMNTPGTHSEDNWRWRFEWDQLHPEAAPGYRHLLGLYGRLL